MKIRKFVGMLLLPFFAIGFTSCNDDDETKDPEGTVTLNMLNEENGKTTLGESDVYINNSNNFKTSSCYIADAGNASGLGSNFQPQLNTLAQEVAVVPGHLYQIYDKDMIHRFPSGSLAVHADLGYYKAYVMSEIKNGTVVTGATVKYALTYPDSEGLPSYGEVIGTLDEVGDSFEYNLSKNGECDFFDSPWNYNKDAFKIQINNNKLVVTLLKPVNTASGPYGEYNLYIRSGSTYTLAQVNIGMNK